MSVHVGDLIYTEEGYGVVLPTSDDDETMLLYRDLFAHRTCYARRTGCQVVFCPHGAVAPEATRAAPNDRVLSHNGHLGTVVSVGPYGVQVRYDEPHNGAYDCVSPHGDYTLVKRDDGQVATQRKQPMYLARVHENPTSPNSVISGVFHTLADAKVNLSPQQKASAHWQSSSVWDDSLVCMGSNGELLRIEMAEVWW